MIPRGNSGGPALSRSDVADSRLLSLVLRHRPERAGIVLDPAGWVAIDDLLAGLARMGRPMSRARLEQLVARDGWVFRVSAYGVWLVDAVPPAYVSRQGPD